MGEVPLYGYGNGKVVRIGTRISSGRVQFLMSEVLMYYIFMIKTRAQRKLLHTCIIVVIVKQYLVQIDRIDGLPCDVVESSTCLYLLPWH